MSQTLVQEGYDQRSAAGPPKRETPDFAALAKLFPKWDATDLEVLWEHNDEISTLAQFKYFLTYANSNALDPLKDEVVATMRWNSVRKRYEVTPIVKIGVLRKRRAVQCDGIDAFEFEEDPSGKTRWPVAVSGKIYRKEAKSAFCAKVWFTEYAPLDENGYITTLWANKGHLMIAAALEAQLTRLAFYDLVGDMKIDEETQRGEEVAPQGQAKPKEDEFVVGEKEPVRPADAAPVETKPAEPETKPPVAETKPAVNGTPAPPTEPGKTPGQRAGEKFWEGKEQAAEPPQIKYGIRQVVMVEDKQELRTVNEPDSAAVDSTQMRARALANEKGQTFVVVKLIDGKIDTREGDDGVIGVYKPLPKPKTKAAEHAAAARATAQPKEEAKPEGVTATEVKQAVPGDFDTMIAAISAKIGGPTKDAHLLIKRYLGAYLNIPRGEPTPKEKSALTPAVAALHAVVAAQLDELKANPEGLGIRLSGRVDPLEEEFGILNWPPNVRALARQVIALMGQTPETFREWIHLPIAGNEQAGTAMEIAAIDPAGLEIFFPLFLLVKGRAFEVADWALANGQNVTHALRQMVAAAATPVEKWDAKFAAAVIDTIKKCKPADMGPAVEDKQAAVPPVDDVDAWALNAGLPFEE